MEKCIVFLFLCIIHLCVSLQFDCSQLLLYHRIQKSGSTCIAEALEKTLHFCGRYKTTKYISFELKRDKNILYDSNVYKDAEAVYTPQLSMLHGHFYFGIHNSLPLGTRTAIYITSMVEPVQRIMSHFNFRKRIGLLQKQLSVSKEEVTWELFLNNPTVLMCNEMVAVFSGTDRLTQSCGDYTHEDYKRLYTAKRNLKEYQFIFLRAHMEESWTMMNRIVSQFPSQPSCAWDNVSHRPKELPNRVQFEKLKKAFMLDRLLYRYAEDLFFAQAKKLQVQVQNKPTTPWSTYYTK